MKTHYFIANFSLIMLFTCFMFLHEIEKPEHQFDWTEIRPQIKDSVLVMADFNEVTSKFVGYGGYPSQQYDRGKWFMDEATDNELHKLIQYENSAVKAYSFKGLLKRKDKNIYTYLIESFNDSTIVYYQSGCTGMEFSLFEYYVNQINWYFCEACKNQKPLFNEKQKAELNQLVKQNNLNNSSLLKLSYIE